MKKYLLIITISYLLLLSCNNRKDYFFNQDTSPILNVYNPVSNIMTTTSYSDSAKIGVMYSTNYTYTSQAAASVSINQIQGNDSTGISSNKVFIMPKTEGLSEFDITATDKFSKTATVNLFLTVFKNLLPVSSYTSQQVTNGLSPYEISIDATKSYDRDSKWGGTVVAYKYKINTNYEITTQLSSIHYICNEPGEKVITVTVQDNNGDWSSPVTTYLNVQ